MRFQVHIYEEVPVLATARLFKTGHSQAVRLPKEFRMPGDEVCICKDEATGAVTLIPKPDKDRVDAFFALLEATPVPEEFMAERDNRPGEFRDIF